MIIRSFAELKPAPKIWRQPEPAQNPALANAQRYARNLERERERMLAQLLPDTVEVRPERRQKPIPDHAFKSRGYAATKIEGEGPEDWGQPHELHNPNRPPVFYKNRRGARATLRTGADLHVPLPAIPEPEDKRLLNSPVKRRSIRKVPNGGRLKLTGAAHGAYRFHPAALGE